VAVPILAFGRPNFTPLFFHVFLGCGHSRPYGCTVLSPEFVRCRGSPTRVNRVARPFQLRWLPSVAIGGCPGRSTSGLSQSSAVRPGDESYRFTPSPPSLARRRQRTGNSDRGAPVRASGRLPSADRIVLGLIRGHGCTLLRVRQRDEPSLSSGRLRTDPAINFPFNEGGELLEVKKKDTRFAAFVSVVA